MDQTLKKIRQTFINSYQAGFDKEDRKIQSPFIDELVFQARAAIILQYPEFDPQCLQSKVFNITKVSEPNGFYFTADINTINETKQGIGLYLIKAIKNNRSIQVPFEIQTLSKFFQAKHDRYTKDKTKIALSGNTLYIRTAPSINQVTQIEIHCVFFNPFSVTSFTEDSPFPFTSGLIPNLIEMMYSIYLTKIAANDDTKNDSAEEIGKAKQAPQPREQQPQ